MKLAAFDGANVFVIRPLNRVEIQSILGAMRKLYKMHDEMQIMLLVMLNQRAFDEAYQAYIAEVAQYGGLGSGRLSFISVDMSRHLLNFLSSFTTFLDHARGDLVRRFQESSAEVKRFDEVRRNLHKETFAYRFLYALRNYALHFGLPIHRVVSQSSANPDGTKTNSLTLMIDADKLLENPKWKASISGELTNLDNLNFSSLIAEIISCVQRLMGLKNELCGENVLQPLLILESFERECLGKPGVPYLLPMDFGNSPNVEYRVHDFPVGIMRSLRSGLEAAEQSNA